MIRHSDLVPVLTYLTACLVSLVQMEAIKNINWTTLRYFPQASSPMEIVCVALQQYFKLLQQLTDKEDRILEGRQKFNMGTYVYTNLYPSYSLYITKSN
jgi:hypothetical protein